MSCLILLSVCALFVFIWKWPAFHFVAWLISGSVEIEVAGWCLSQLGLDKATCLFIQEENPENITGRINWIERATKEVSLAASCIC